MEPVHVKLGQHEVPVYEQRWAYLQRRIFKVVEGVTGSTDELSGENIVGFLGEKTYDALAALIPKLESRLPEYEFKGFVSKEAMDADDYDPEQDQSPSLPEIINAFEAAIYANRLDVVRDLGKALSRVLDQTEGLRASPSLPSTNGTSGSTSSSPMSQT